MTLRIASYTIILCALLSILALGTVQADEQWLSPDQHTPTNWIDPANAYDDDMGSFSYRTDPAGWTGYLPLRLGDVSFSSDKLRYHWWFVPGEVDTVSVNIYVSDGGWHWVNIYNEDCSEMGGWVEFEYGRYWNVRNARLKFELNAESTVVVFEMDFWHEERYPDSLVVSPGHDENDLFLGESHTFIAVVKDKYDDVMSGVDVEWELTGVGEIESNELTTDENGEAECVIVCDETGTTTIECCAVGFDLCDQATKDWIDEYTIELLPSYDENDLGTNHTFVATLKDGQATPVENINIVWNITGVGWFLCSENITDAAGEVESTITSNITGNSTVNCCVLGYDLCDESIKHWLGPRELYAPFPIWMIFFIGLLMGVAVYTSNVVIVLAGVLSSVVAIVWLSNVGLSDLSYLIAACVLYCGIGLFVLLIIRKGVEHGKAA